MGDGTAAHVAGILPTMSGSSSQNPPPRSIPICWSLEVHEAPGSMSWSPHLGQGPPQRPPKAWAL